MFKEIKNKKRFWIILFIIFIIFITLLGRYSEDGSKIKTPEQQIEEQFSQWDGANYVVVDAVKKRMNDPNSFEHEETNYWIIKDTNGNPEYVVVKMVYRGKNVFGGVVKNLIRAEISLDGKLLNIKQEN